MEENDEEQANAVYQAFDMYYDVAPALCSYIVPKDLLLFTIEALDDNMDFELEDGEGDYNDNEGGDNKGGGGMGSPFPELTKTTGE